MDQGDQEPEERTSTLVLTSPKNFFIDLRIIKDIPIGPDAIDWAFAGRSHRSPGSGSWDHWVDSRTDTPGPDTGSFETLPNGDVLEKGSMLDDNGVLRSYQEIWRDEAVKLDIAIVFACLGDPEAAEESEFDPKMVSGMVIRVGNWCQGLLKINGEVMAERRELKDGVWRQDFKIGRDVLPCEEVCSETFTRLDILHTTKIIYMGNMWRCVDRHVGKE